MADRLMDQLRDLLDGQIDFEGQKLAEIFTTALLVTAAMISILVGFVQQDITRALYIGLGGTALTFLLVVPPWPFYNRHPIKWLPAVGLEQKSNDIAIDGMVVT